MRTTSRRLLLTAPLGLALVAFAARAQQSPDAGVPDAGSGNAGLSVTGPSDESVADGTVAGGHVILKGNPDDRVSIGGSVVVGEQESVGDAVAVGGTATIFGHTRGDAVSVGGTLHVGPHAVVDGDAVVVGGSMDVDDGAVIKGQRLVLGSLMGLGGIAGLAGAIGTIAAIWMVVSAIVSILGLIALGALFIAFIPERLERMKDVMIQRPWPAVGVGVATFVGIVPATLILVVSIIGILLIPFLWMAFGLVIALGLCIVAQHIGERLLRGTKFAGPIPSLAAGALLLTLVRLVPFIGSVAFLAAMILGTGAVLLARLGTPPRLATTPATPVVDQLAPPSIEG